MLGYILMSLAIQQGLWGGIPPMPDARQEVGVVATEGLVYVIGGLARDGGNSSRVDYFDTRTGEWRQAPSFPITIHHPMVAVVGPKVYVAGGYTDPGFFAHAFTYEFDPDRSIWTRKADMPTPRGAGAAATYDGKIFVFGGDRSGITVDDAAVYDPITDSWKTLPSMPTPRNHTGATVVRGKIYVVGGRPGNLAVNEMFDPITETWTVKAPMPTGRSGIAVTSLDKYVYVLGGEGNPSSPIGIFEENEAYDVDQNEWISLEPMPLPRHGIGAGVIGNRIYVPGGGPVSGYGVTEQSDFFEVAQDIVLPQFVVGAGYRSEIVVTNPASRASEVKISVSDITGNPLSTTLDGSNRSESSFTLPALASRTINAPDVSGSLRAGTVRIRANTRLSAFGVIRAAGLPTVTVYPATSARTGTFHVRLSRSDQTNTGIAVTNQGLQPATLTLTLVNASGAEISRIERMLPAGAQLSQFLDEWFSALPPNDFAGTMTVRSTQAIAIAALAFSRDGVVAIPIVPIE